MDDFESQVVRDRMVFVVLLILLLIAVVCYHNGVKEGMKKELRNHQWSEEQLK